MGRLSGTRSQPALGSAACTVGRRGELVAGRVKGWENAGDHCLTLTWNLKEKILLCGSFSKFCAILCYCFHLNIRKSKILISVLKGY